MTRVKIKRVYDAPTKDDGFRVLADRLWPRGVSKEKLPYDLWAKDLAPSPELRRWYHAAPEERWDEFTRLYREELDRSSAASDLLGRLGGHPVITLLYASKNAHENHALILQKYLEKKLG